MKLIWTAPTDAKSLPHTRTPLLEAKGSDCTFAIAEYPGGGRYDFLTKWGLDWQYENGLWYSISEAIAAAQDREDCLTKVRKVPVPESLIRLAIEVLDDLGGASTAEELRNYVKNF